MKTTPRAFLLATIEPTEHQTQDAILRYLALERRVAWVERFNVGAAKAEGYDANGRRKDRWIKFAFPGCSDLLGQMRDGRFLAIEVKAPGRYATPQQRAFLARVASAGGVAILARCIEDVRNAIDACCHSTTSTAHNEPHQHQARP